MRGKSRFTATEAREIRELLARKTRGSRDEQKQLRQRIRKLGFFISDFQEGSEAFSTADFDRLVSRKVITIADDEPE